MKSSLQTLQRIQKFNIDEQRKILAELQTNEEKLQSGLERLNAEYEREKEFASAHPGTGDFGAYTKRYLQYREAFERQLAAVRRKFATKSPTCLRNRKLLRLSTTIVKNAAKRKTTPKSRKPLMKSARMPI